MKKMSPSENIDTDKLDFNFATEVSAHAGTELRACYHCWCCAGGCPFVHAMDYTPNSVIRLVQLGLRKQALECSTIWLCVGCHTCSTVCPMSVDMASVMDTLRQMAMREGMVIAEPGILNFHREVLNSIESYGRTHKLEIMMRYKIRRRDWFSDMDVGIKMLAKRKLDLRPSRVRAIEDIKKLFQK